MKHEIHASDQERPGRIRPIVALGMTAALLGSMVSLPMFSMPAP
jgi:hypothetical protein